jgi:hypothetical protein
MAIGNYNFISQLQKLPILELYEPEVSGKLVQRLFDGERQPVHLDLISGATNGFIETDPRRKGLNLYNSDGQLIDIAVFKKERVLKVMDKTNQQTGLIKPTTKKQRNKNKGRSI